MALTAKTAQTVRSSNVNGDGTLGSGLARVQTRRGQGNLEDRYQFGATNLVKTAVVEYDFTIDGAIPLVTTPAALGTGIVIPQGSIVTSTLWDVIVPSATGTLIQASVMNDADLLSLAVASAVSRYSGTVGIVALAANTVYASQAPSKVGVLSVAVGGITTAGVITVGTPFGQSAVVGQKVTISGCTGADAPFYNGTFSVTAVAATTITVTLDKGTPAAVSAGTASVALGDKEILLSMTGAANTAGKWVLYVDYVSGTVA